MKTIIHIIFIFITVSSPKNETTNKDINEVENLDKELLCHKSGNNNNFQNTALKELVNDIFSGLWINEDEKTESITKFNIRYDNNRFYVQMWGACHPSDCDWGEIATDKVEIESHKFDLIWNQGFVLRTLTYEYIDGKLKLTVKSHFKDESGRSDLTLISYFIKR